MRVPILVGENNPHGADPRYDLYPLPRNSAGGRLCHDIFLMRRSDYMRSFYRRNLLHGGRWRAGAAHDAAARLLSDHPSANYVLLGAKVCAAFGVSYIRDFECYSMESGPRFLRLPHPSGRCRVWNDPAAYEKARAALRDFLPDPAKTLIGQGSGGG